VTRAKWFANGEMRARDSSSDYRRCGLCGPCKRTSRHPAAH